MKSQIKRILLAHAIFGAFFVSSAAFACGGGDTVQLNDDSILSVDGIRFPITDPNNEKGYLIEDLTREYQVCVRRNKNPMALSTECRTFYRVTDSKGKTTHEVAMVLEGSRAMYMIKNIETKVTDVYEGQLHTRGGCGLQKLPGRAPEKSDTP